MVHQPQEGYNEIEDLRHHSRMLGQIAVEVEDWCISGDSTTLEAVRHMKLELLEYRLKDIQDEIERLIGWVDND